MKYIRLRLLLLAAVITISLAAPTTALAGGAGPSDEDCLGIPCNNYLLMLSQRVLDAFAQTKFKASVKELMAVSNTYPAERRNMSCVWTPYTISGKTGTTWCRNYDWGTIPNNNSVASVRSPNLYSYRNCTDYVAWRLAKLGVPEAQYKDLHNGKDWAVNAAKHGINVNSTPAAGTVAVSETGTCGHVAFVHSVTQVKGKTMITVSDYNKHNDGTWDKRTDTAQALGFTKFVHFEPYESALVFKN